MKARHLKLSPERPAVPLALAALSGAVVGGVLPLGPLPFALGAALVALGAAFRRSVALLLVAVALLGVARRLDARQSEPVLLDADHDVPALLKVHVVSEPLPRFGGVEVLVEVEEGATGPGAWSAREDEASGPGEPAPRGLRLHARIARAVRRRAGDLLTGRRLELAGRLRAPREPATDDSFDERAQLVREGASAFLIVERAWKLGGDALGPASWLGRLGRRARAAIRSARLDKDSDALVRALVLGDRNGMAPATKQAFRSTNMVHAITISGLHVAVLAWLLAGLAKRLPVRARSVFVALGLALYLGLAGPHPSALRATIAGVLVAFAQGWGRGGDAWNRLGVALIAVLAWDPACVEEPGFQLTFGTVAGILALAPLVRERIRHRALATSVAAFFAHGPILVVHSGQVALVGIVANLPALPLTEAALVLGLGGAALGVVHPLLGRPLLLLAGLAARALIALVALAARVPPLDFTRPSPLAGALAISLVVLGFTFRRRLLVGAGVVAFLAASLPTGVGEVELVVAPTETRITGRVENLGAGIRRIEQGATSALVLDDPGGRELARVLAETPEGRLRASVLVLRAKPSAALDRLLARTDPRLVVTPDARASWRITLGALPGVERYHPPR